MIRFYACASFGNEIRVFSVDGPSPCTYNYTDVIGTFPNTKAGHKAAMALTGEKNG